MKFLLQEIYCNRYMAVDKRRNIFDFNHIDTALSQGTIGMLKNFYAYFPKKHYGYEKRTTAFKEKPTLICNIVAGKAVITSVVAGGVTLNPIVFASLTGFGLVVKAVASFKNYGKKNRESQLCQGRVQENS